MPVRQILLLGDPRLYEACNAIQPDEVNDARAVVTDLHDTMMAFREQYGVGRAIAAPQIGVLKRIVYMNIEGQSTVFINPELRDLSDEMMELWDDCMSFPDLLVRVRRHRSCRIRFCDLDWAQQEWKLDGDLSELLQHECDHLDGVLAVARAIDNRSFALRSQRDRLE